MPKPMGWRSPRFGSGQFRACFSFPLSIPKRNLSRNLKKPESPGSSVGRKTVPENISCIPGRYSATSGIPALKMPGYSEVVPTGGLVIAPPALPSAECAGLLSDAPPGLGSSVCSWDPTTSEGFVSVLSGCRPDSEGLEVLDSARAPRETQSNAS